MSSLHIIYDPHDKLSHNAQMNNAIDLCVAVIPIPTNIETSEALEGFAQRALKLFMENFPEESI